MEITLVSSPEINTYMSEVAEYHAIYINFRKLVKAKINKVRLHYLITAPQG